MFRVPWWTSRVTALNLLIGVSIRKQNIAWKHTSFWGSGQRMNHQDWAKDDRIKPFMLARERESKECRGRNERRLDRGLNMSKASQSDREKEEWHVFKPSLASLNWLIEECCLFFSEERNANGQWPTLWRWLLEFQRYCTFIRAATLRRQIKWQCGPPNKGSRKRRKEESHVGTETWH